MARFSLAFGQYAMYRDFIREIEPERHLYLALGDDTYNDLFKLKSIQFIAQVEQLSILVVNLVSEEIAEWIN